MEETFSKTSADFPRTTRRYTPEDKTARNYSCENLRSYKVNITFLKTDSLNLLSHLRNQASCTCRSHTEATDWIISNKLGIKENYHTLTSLLLRDYATNASLRAQLWLLRSWNRSFDRSTVRFLMKSDGMFANKRNWMSLLSIFIQSATPVEKQPRT
jgi:hypothetical protein